MAEVKKVKILVISDINGAFDKCFTHVTKLNEKAGPFHMLLCIGKFYGAAENSQKELEAYISGQKQMSIPTFFIVPPEEESRLPKPVLVEGGVIAENLVYLGRVGCKDINGFQIAYISTLTAKEEIKPGQAASTSESAAIEAELARVFKSPGFPGVDVLLSNHWPHSVLNELGDNPPPVGVSLMEYDTFGSELIRKAAVALAPRYHFAASPSHIHYERPPFVCDLNSKTIVHVSRFIALADAFNDKKAKFVYAFTTQPLKSMPKEELATQPPNTTLSPFVASTSKKTQQSSQGNDSRKRSFEEMERNDRAKPAGSHMYQQVERASNDRGPKRQKRDEPREDHPLLKRMAGCWFCLSNPEVEKHLIVSIGDECYLTLAKGGLTPHHSLIVPIAHAGATTFLEDASMAEINRYKDALRRCFEAQQMGVVFVEHHLPTKQNTVHCVIQVAPMPMEICANAQKQFESAAKELDMELAILEPHETLKQIAGDRFYIYAELPDGTRLLHLVRADARTRIPIQFGRRVLARLLGDPKREDWKACAQPTATETQYCKAMKELFKSYDFTLA
eukprot:TRINITY_DN15511_c0_g1_i1.p1 TRINITY_DN15511_c0_g1~~TRINITY_DN15511_c0_g1_i1.p1  ORF type:complete len:578 (+),score=80.51 TRINITY_DN15511_c0_g1_i1:47-1735(+)